MGNFLVLCIAREMHSTKKAILKVNSNVLQIVKVDGKILEFRNPIFVKDLLSNYTNCYVGMFKEATQALPLDYKLKIGKIYYLLPCIDQLLDGTTTKSYSRNDLRSANMDHSSLDTSQKSTTIKVVITKEQLKQLLVAEDGRIEDLLLGGNNNTSKRVCSINEASTNTSIWMPKLESIPEGSDDDVVF